LGDIAAARDHLAPDLVAVLGHGGRIGTIKFGRELL
jgi:hypothetical protein